MANVITPKERVDLARNPGRPNIREYVSALITDFYEIHGDRGFRDDPAILTGIGRFRGTAVTVAGHVKGRELEDNLACNFGMPNPEGYRKFQRALEQAEKFRRPVITFVDTPGAYPGAGAEERGQGEAIARCLYLLSNLRVPVIAVVTGEGGSGGALALSVSDRLLMLENTIFSVLSPEGFASILWKDAGKSAEACDVMKLTAEDLLSYKIADRIIPEPAGGAHTDPGETIRRVGAALSEELALLQKSGTDMLVAKRYRKLRGIGV